MATVEIFLYLKIVNSIRIIALSSHFRLYVTFVTFLTKPLASLREAVKKTQVFYGQADRKEEGEEKDRREREEEEGITQLLPLYPMSIRLWHGVYEHGGHGHGQNKLCRLSPLSYQINLEFAQVTLLSLVFTLSL